MNTKQRDTWQRLVQQCEAQCTQPYYSSINVASKIRSEAIVAAGVLVKLVTPELAELLEYLAEGIDCLAPAEAGVSTPTKTDNARARAARIREALETSK